MCSFLLQYMLWQIELKFCIWLCFYVLQIMFKCRHSASVWLSDCPSIFCTCLHWQLSWNFEFDFSFVNAFLLEIKVLFKNSLLKCSWRAYYAPFAVLRYILLLLWNHWTKFDETLHWASTQCPLKYCVFQPIEKAKITALADPST